MSIDPPGSTVVVAGIRRSGTTWLYNAIRSILLTAGYDTWGGGTVDYQAEPLIHDVSVVKEHRFLGWLADEADVVFNAWRDEQEVAASWERFRGETLTAPQMASWVRQFELWEQHSDYTMHYPDMVYASSPISLLVQIGHVLGVEVDAGAACERLRREMKPPTDTRKDPITLVFQNHYTSQSYEDTLRYYEPEQA